MTSKEFSILSNTIPTNPGIYKYYDIHNELIYVGKAKHLRKRVSSYFAKNHTSFKTIELVSRIKRIEFTIVNNEHDALLLENTLIKEYQPKYNISLKDDKTYPYIVVKNEPFPRVFFTRRKINDGSTYFGPYTSVQSAKELLNFIKQNILLRTCKLNLSDNNIKRKKFKVCLEYHLGNCKGPCEGLQTAEDYATELQQLTNLLKGNLSPVIQHFKKEMHTLAASMAFERAEIYRKKIEHLKNYQVNSAVVNTRMGTVDVFSILEDGNIGYVNYLAVTNGTIVKTKTVILEKRLDETAADLLSFAIADLRLQFKSEAKEIIVPFEIVYAGEDVKITIPKSGDKKKLLTLSEKNVNYFQFELKRKKMLNLEERSEAEKLQVLHQLQKDLHLSQPPLHIECFDNSNLHGSFPVSAVVVFKNGAASKADYRRFKVKTVVGINDFASMKEAVYRRYKRLIEENQSIPQLIIIDGGKGQLSAAMQSVNLLRNQENFSAAHPFNYTTVVGLAKNEEEIFFPGDTQSIKLPWESASLKLIRHIRDEVHNHGITFHRNLRSKGAFNNELEQIAGIGKSTIDFLLKKFKSVKQIKEKSIDDLTEVIGKKRADLVVQYFLGKK
ncbi:MAG: excinuclease ABC subunit C [Chitinophagaceae bacterium]|nr:excinuclease ABC subunit C [Chitinophagaceae bacterium]